MKYGFLPRAMWLVFRGSFQKQLSSITQQNSGVLMRKALEAYRTILSAIPKFDRDDRFVVNILSASMLAAVYLNLPKKPGLSAMTNYYHNAMTQNAVMKIFLNQSNHYTEISQAKLKRQAEASQKRANPYTWKFRYEPGKNSNSFTACFDTCGICYLFRKLGIAEILPAMCTYDYDMAEFGGTVFTRKYTLASGGPYCDCHYCKKEEQ